MSLTIKNGETDRLVRELAEMRGLSLVDAVHEAVKESLRRERSKPDSGCEAWLSEYDALLEGSREAAAALGTDERRLLIARLYGADSAIHRFVEDVWAPALIMTAALFLAPFVEKPPHSISLGILILDVILLIQYSRHLSKETKFREEGRQLLEAEVRSTSTSLPQELSLLSRIPQSEPDDGLLEKCDAVYSGKGVGMTH
jgi:hypothetical protein